MSCFVSCALLAVLALLVCTTRADCLETLIATAHVPLFLLGAAIVLVGSLVRSW
jgi:hypothetical protein